MAPNPKIGRNTKGGRVMTSKPLREVLTRAGVATRVGLVEGAEGLGESSGEGDAEGDGDAVACSAKVAHGFGGTLAHKRCTPGVSPANGLTLLLKLPLASAVALPPTWLGESQ